jgi:hypothetical protein
MSTRFDDVVIFGNDVVFTDGVTIPDGANVSPGALDAHQHNKTYFQNGTAVAATVAIHEVRGTSGRIRAVRAGSVAIAVGDSTVTIDVKKNGVTILSGTIQLDNANVAYTSEAGTLSVTSVAAGDVITVVQTVSAGTGTLPTGVWTTVVIDEDYVS